MTHCRLELTTTKEKIFLGPFVYGVEDGVRKLSQMGWLERTAPEGKRGQLRLVAWERPWPKEALWHPSFDDESGGRHDKRIAQVMAGWKRLALLLGEEGEEGKEKD